MLLMLLPGSSKAAALLMRKQPRDRRPTSAPVFQSRALQPLLRSSLANLAGQLHRPQSAGAPGGQAPDDDAPSGTVEGLHPEDEGTRLSADSLLQYYGHTKGHARPNSPGRPSRPHSSRRPNGPNDDPLIASLDASIDHATAWRQFEAAFPMDVAGAQAAVASASQAPASGTVMSNRLSALLKHRETLAARKAGRPLSASSSLTQQAPATQQLGPGGTHWTSSSLSQRPHSAVASLYPSSSGLPGSGSAAVTSSARSHSISRPWTAHPTSLLSQSQRTGSSILRPSSAQLSTTSIATGTAPPDAPAPSSAAGATRASSNDLQLEPRSKGRPRSAATNGVLSRDPRGLSVLITKSSAMLKSASWQEAASPRRPTSAPGRAPPPAGGLMVVGAAMGTHAQRTPSGSSGGGSRHSSASPPAADQAAAMAAWSRPGSAQPAAAPSPSSPAPGSPSRSSALQQARQAMWAGMAYQAA